jgi:recombination protein RecR
MTEKNSHLKQLVDELEKLPGIGRRSAERIAYHLLLQDAKEVLPLAKALEQLKTSTRHCSVCFNISESEPCEVCADPSRNTELLCIVENLRDLVKFEKSGAYQGLYHVLHGSLSPLDGINEDHLTLKALMTRLKKKSFQEIIIATGVNLSGEATALHLQDLLQGFPGKITRIAKGLPSGSLLEFASDAVLNDAINGRRVLYPGKQKGQVATEYILLFLFLSFSFLIFSFSSFRSENLFSKVDKNYHSWWQWPVP